MKKLLILALAAIGFASCGNDIAETANETNQSGFVLNGEAYLTEQTRASLATLSMPTAATFGEDDAPATRAGVTTAADKSMKLSWNNSTSLPLHVYFKNTTTNQTAVATTTISVDPATLKGKFKVNVPASVASGNLYIAVGTGQESGVTNGAWVSGIDNSGKLSVGYAQTTNATNTNYNIPLYSELTRVNTESATEASASVKLNILGCFIAPRVKSNMLFNTAVYSIAIESDKIRRNGALQFGNPGTSAQWTSAQPNVDPVFGAVEKNTDNIRVTGLTVGRTQNTTAYSAPFYIWMKPNAANATIPTKVYARDEPAQNQPFTSIKSTRYIFYRSTNNAPYNFQDGKVYVFNIPINLSHPLIFTEYRKPVLATGNLNMIEITNVSNQTVSLKDYYLVAYNPEDKKEYTMNLTDLSNIGDVEIGGNSTTSLPAGKSIVLFGGGRTANSVWDDVINNNNPYQAINQNRGRRLVGQTESAIWGGIRAAHYITYKGVNIDLNDPNNNVIDVIGVRTKQETTPSASSLGLKQYFYYMGSMNFIRYSESDYTAKGFVVPTQSWMNGSWGYRTIGNHDLGIFPSSIMITPLTNNPDDPAQGYYNVHDVIIDQIIPWS